MSNKTRQVQGHASGKGAAGYPLGIIAVETNYPLLPGNIVNASSYSFPVYVKVLAGVGLEEIIQYDKAITEKIIAAGNELIDLGVRAVVGACGSFAFYQKEVAAELSVPTFMSVMLQTSLIEQGLKPEQSIAVIAAKASAVSERVFTQCNITNPERLHVHSAVDLEECLKLYYSDPVFNNEKLEYELVELAQEIFKQRPDTGAILLQCSDLPPYASSIQSVTGLPVFDMHSLIEWVRHAVLRFPYQGYV